MLPCARPFVLILSSLLCSLAVALADDSEFGVKVQPTPSLADPEATGFKPKLVNDLNATEYQPLIIPELYPWVRAGSLQFEAASRLKYNFRVERGSEPINKALDMTLSGAGSIDSASTLQVGSAFGPYESFKDDANTQAKGQKIIWNVTSRWWSNKLIDADFDLLHPAEGKADVTFRGSLSRVYPKILDSKDKTIQVFRELLRFHAPAFLDGLSWLTFRFFGADEDVLMIYSPLLKSVRELTASNRADPLVKSSFSPDDILIWSGKPELVEANFDRELRAFAIFSGLNEEELLTSPNCMGLSFNDRGLEGHQNWNFQSGKFPNGAAWLPSSAVFIPRDMLRVELISKDPFSLYGRQVLYLDRETMLPFYKIVYDRAGREWKVAMAVYSLAVSRDKKTALPVMVSEIVSDVIRNLTYVMDFSRFMVCSNYTDSVKLSDFDPGKLGPELPPQKPIEKQKKKEAR